jgi:protocatechuate 3,4-dioxygenase beta subunit
MNTTPASSSRRRLAIASAAAFVGWPALHLRAATLRATPAQTEGPFYPDRMPPETDGDLLAIGSARYAQGQPAWVEGTLTDTEGRALDGASVEIWQCDHEGRYHHSRGGGADPTFQGFGRVAVDAQGRWRFRTIRPAPYTGRTPHIHVKVKRGARELLTTQFYVEGDAGNARDGIWRRLRAEDRALVTSPFVAGADGLTARYSLVVPAS